MRALIVAVVLGALVVMPQTMLEAVAADDAPALVELDVNGVGKGDAVAIARGDAVIGVDVAALEKAGIVVPAASEFTRDGRRYADPGHLGPRVRATYDARQLVLSLIVTTTSVQRLDLSAAQPSADFSHPSASLDYDLLGIGGLERQLSLSGAIVAGRDQLVAQDVVGNAYSQPTVFLERDDPARRFEYQAGQFQTTSDAELPSLTVFGIQGLRDFSLTPLAPGFPQPVYSGIANEPSVADVYVGGVLTRSVPVAPGPFALQGIVNGAGSDVRIVLRNAQGVVQTLAGNNFANINLLARGTTDRSYALGRDLYTGGPAVDAMYRLGLTNHWTAGLRVRDDAGLLTNALSSDFGFGSAQLHLGVVQAGDERGYDVFASLFGTRTRIGLGYSALPPTIDTETFLGTSRNLSLEAATSLGRSVQVSAQVSRQELFGQPASQSIVTNAGLALPHGVTAAVTFERDYAPGSRPTNRISLQFSGSKVSHDGRFVDSTNVAVSPQGSYLNVSTAPTGDIGPHANIRLGQGYSQLNYGYAAAVGVADASLVQLPTGYAASYEFKGAIGVIDGHVKLAQTLGDGFALVEIPGLPSAPVYANGRFVGSTAADGTLLVGGLGSYQASTIDIHPNDLALDVQLDNVQTIVVPPRRGGSVALFPVRFVTLVQAHVSRYDGGTLAAAATIDFAKGERRARARLDEFDDFVVDRLEPGRWSFTVLQASEQPCAGSFVVPGHHQALVDLGTLECRFQSAAH